MNPSIRFFTHVSQFMVAAFVAAAALAGVNSVQASPDPPVSITNGVVLFQGNQANGIFGGVGGDFQTANVSTLNVNSLTGAIQPGNGVSGINFQKTGAGDVAINAGVAGGNIVINTTNAAGIVAGTVGSPPANPPPDPFWGVPIPASSSAQGGVVQVHSYSDITNQGNNAAGILATSQTTGYSQTIIQGLTNLVNAGVTFTVIGVTNAGGTNVAIGGPVTGTLVDTSGTNLLGAAGTFTINSTGAFSFDAGTNLSGLAVGESYQSLVNYTVQGVNKTRMTNDDMGTLLAVITMTTNGLVTNCGAYFDTYGPSTNQNSALPDLGTYGQTLAANASAGGAGNSVTVTNEGSIKTYGTNSSGIFARSLGGDGGAGRGGSISHSAGQGGAGSNGGKVTVTANGSITTISNYSCGVVAWSQGGTGGNGGNGGTWRYGARGGTGGDAGEVDIVGNGTIHTYGGYASGILAVSVGGDGGDGGSGGGVTGGGNGGFGGHGSNVVVNGNWNITTEGDNAYGIWAKSVGGNAGTGGSGGWLAGARGGGGGNGGYAVAGSIGDGVSVSVAVGGKGGSGGSASNVVVDSDSDIATRGTGSHGIFAQSVGGGGGTGGFSLAISGSQGASLSLGIGGGGGGGGNGQEVTVGSSGSIETFGDRSYGILAQSVGGGGGDGGFSISVAGSLGGLALPLSFGGTGGTGGCGGLVFVTNSATIITHSNDAHGILAQSVGGGGGSGGFSIAGAISTGNALSLSFGGTGGGGGAASNVTVINAGNIATFGDRSYGVLAQSVGGGGGDGGFSVSGGVSGGSSVGFSMGGNGAGGGAGGNVYLENSGSIFTTGNDSHALIAQSIGGGGGSGGFSVAGGISQSPSVQIGIGGKGGSGANGGDVTLISDGGTNHTEGDRAYGIFAQSVGGGGGDGGFGVAGGITKEAAVSFAMGGNGSTGGMGGLVIVDNSSRIETEGDLAHGILAQSLGGGGGAGGFSMAGSLALSQESKQVSVAIGGDGGGGGAGSNVMVFNSGTIVTLGERANGIFAQSVGGGGGDGGEAKVMNKSLGMVFTNSGSAGTNDKGWSLSIAIGAGGKGGSAGNGGAVVVTNLGTIYTGGSNSIGIMAQSVGGGGGSGGLSATDASAGGGKTSVSLNFGLGGAGGGGGTGNVVTVVNQGTITTVGDASHGIFAQSVGGGGGLGGASTATTSSPDSDTSHSVTLSAVIGGTGGPGGNGSNVVVQQDGNITTYGEGAYGILAQSVGGGGGDGGTAKIEAEKDTNSLSLPTMSVAAAPAASTNSGEKSWSVNLSFGLGGKGGIAGDGGQVTVDNQGNITNYGANSIGIFAQSVGGGGGAGGMSQIEGRGDSGNTNMSLSISLGGGVGGAGGAGGAGNTVAVTNQGTIITGGDAAHGIFAQSVGGGGGLGGASAVSKSTPESGSSVTLTAAIGGGGGAGGNGGDVAVAQDGTITTYGEGAYGILAQSVGGGGGMGGTAKIETEQDTNNAAQPAVEAVSPSDTSTNSSEKEWSVDLSFGLGGSGGIAGNGGQVTVDNRGSITNYGANSIGIFAQSVGGGGGAGGMSQIENAADGKSTNLSLSISLGGSVGGGGGAGGSGGVVQVTSEGSITTFGDAGYGIVAQSIGGGNGGASAATTASAGDKSVNLTVTIGGSGGAAGNGGAVIVDNQGQIDTWGDGAYGILAQSVGGGGGNGGTAKIETQEENTNSASSSAIEDSDTNAPSWSINLGVGIGGGGGSGGNGGGVTVNNASNITTHGTSALGIFAQSVGGGGGIAGNVNQGISSAGLSLNLGQSGGAGGDGGDVTVVSAGNIITHGNGAYGIFAQSVGGGGGLAGDLGNGLSFAGSVGGAGSGGTVHITHTGNITTYGDNADGIFAQSAGGTNVGAPVEIDYIGSINVYGSNSSAIYVQSRGDEAPDNMTLTVHNGVIQGGSGNTAGVWFANGGNNTLYNFNTITTLNGVAGNAIIGDTGNETINNDGIMIGSVDLGNGQNQFNNYSGSRLNAGPIINLGAGNLFLNNGALSPGGPGVLETTALTGNFLQFSNGVAEVELGSTTAYDRLAVSGTASLDGTLSVARLGNFVPAKGDQFTVLTATNGVTGQFTALNDPFKGIYALQLGTLYEANEVNLITLQDSFVPFALTHNQRAVAQNLDTFSGFQSTNQLQGDPRETNLIATLDALPGPQIPANFDLIAPEELGALYDMEFGSVDTIVGNVQSRMNDLRNGYASSSGSMSLFTPGGPVMQLASADRKLPPMEKARPNDDWSAFAGGYGQFVHVSSTANASGYSLQNSGVTLDLDKPLDNGLVGGFTLDYAGGEASLINGGSADIEGGRGGIYGTWFNTNAYLEAQLGAGGGYYSNKRAALGGIASGETAGYEIDTMMGGGYDLKFKSLTYGMLAEMHYTYVDINGFTETGSSSPLQIMENDSHSLWTLIGWRFAYDWHISKETFRPELRLGWRHEFMDTTRTIESQMASGAGAVFQVESPSLGRDSLSIVTGLSTRCSQHLSIFAYYDGELARDNAASHTVNGGVSWDF